VWLDHFKDVGRVEVHAVDFTLHGHLVARFSKLRAALQRVLSAWTPLLHAMRAEHKGVLRWAVDVDPLGI
jgi:hypothetical protein